MRSKLRTLLPASLLATLLAIGSAYAQPTNTTALYPTKLPTYRAAIIGLAPAASATDFFTLTGGAGKIVTLRRLHCTGTSTTVASLAVQLISRTTADSGGTATNPVVRKSDPTDANAVATVAAYTVNPTVGTAGGIVAIDLLQTLAPASAGVSGVDFNFNSDPLDTRKAPQLTAATQVLALNANAASFSTGAALSCEVTWTEQ